MSVPSKLVADDILYLLHIFRHFMKIIHYFREIRFGILCKSSNLHKMSNFILKKKKKKNGNAVSCNLALSGLKSPFNINK